MQAKRILSGTAAAVLLFGILATTQAQPVRRAAPAAGATDRVIVKFRDSAARAQAAAGEAAATGRVAALAARSGVGLQLARSISPQVHAVRLERTLAGDALQKALARLRRDGAVEYAVPDARKYRAAVPNDPLYGTQPVTQQWWLVPPDGTFIAPLDAPRAWDVTTGSSDVVVAVLDTGVLFDHPDLGRAESGGKLLPGYDMIADAAVANDGNGRDADPSDPGDWVTQEDRSTSKFSDCEVSDSSWHGTIVAGIVGAGTNNSVGVAGLGWNNWILPVRVLGKCFGNDSDILAGMRWAAGLNVPGVPDNPRPARVLNLSLGSQTSCTQPYLDVLDELKPRGVLVVAAAGNDSAGASSEPGNCPGVISVTSLRHVGTKVGFANWGTDVTIAAPGGNCVNSTGSCLYPIVSTFNAGTQQPGAMTYTNGSDPSVAVGTSFSAPMAAGVAALMLSVNPYLNPQELTARMRSSARPFPPPDPTLLACSDPAFAPDANGHLPNVGQCNCTTTSCGAGMLDAGRAVNAALDPVATIGPTAAPAVGAPLALDGSASVAAPGASIAGYAWTVVSSNPAGAALASASTAQTTLTFPAAGTYVVQLQVVDSAGRARAQTCTVTVLASNNTAQCGQSLPASLPPVVQPPTQAPPADSGGGGGGGAIPALQLLVLLAFAVGAGFRKSRRG